MNKYVKDEINFRNLLFKKNIYLSCEQNGTIVVYSFLRGALKLRAEIIPNYLIRIMPA